MPPQPSLLSSPLRLDLANECLWRGAQVIPLRPKTFAMLRCLVEHPGQLQTKAALFDAIWPGIAVSDVVLTVCIRELRQALGDDARAPCFIETVHQRTDGNPLFMVSVMEDWVTQGLLVERQGQWTLQTEVEALHAGVPESLRQMIERQLDRLSAAEQRILEAGSVAGVEFSAAAVAAALGQEVVPIEECCAALARRTPLLGSRGDIAWPDGTVAGAYGFVHAFYHEVVYNRVTGARRVDLHRRIGEREEMGYGAQASERATVLAVHFERGRDDRRALAYLRQAADNALRRYANADAITHLTKALALLMTLPETPDRAQQELDLQAALGPALMVTKGFAAPQVVHAYARARELCQQVGETAQLFPVVWGLHRFYQARADLRTAHELGAQLLSLAHRAQDPVALMEAHRALGQTLLQIGEIPSALEHLEKGIALYDPQQHRSVALRYGMDPKVICLSHAALALWRLGYPDQALERSSQALTLAQDLAHPFSLANARFWVAWVHQFRREKTAAQEQATAAITLATEQGFPLAVAFGRLIRGWALAAQGQAVEGMRQMRQSLADWRATGGELHRPYFLALLAEACGSLGEIEEGLCMLDEALTIVSNTIARQWEAELYRLKGELLLQQAIGKDGVHAGLTEVSMPAAKGEGATGRSSLLMEPESCFQQALALARRQQAKSLELRATMSLSRLWDGQGKRAAAHKLLAGVYGWFTEGFDTADLQEARALLAELACTR